MAMNKTKTHRNGLETVEAAIVFPLILLLTIGAIQYGWLFLKAQQITSAAREGARSAARHEGDTATGTDAAEYVLDKAGIFAASGRNISFIDYTGNTGDAFECRITVPTANIGIIHFAPEPNNLVGRITMAKEGY